MFNLTVKHGQTMITVQLQQMLHFYFHIMTTFLFFTIAKQMNVLLINNFIFVLLQNAFFHDWGLENLKHKLEKYQMKYLEHKAAKETFSSLLRCCTELNDVSF